MLFKLDNTNIQQNKKLVITNTAQFSILIRLQENEIFSFIPTFSLIKQNESKNFSILHKLNAKEFAEAQIDAIEFQPEQLDSFSTYPFWNEKVKGALKTQTQAVILNFGLNKTISFTSFDRKQSINQTFQEQRNTLNNIETSIRYEQQARKLSLQNNGQEILFQKPPLNSQQSLIINSTKLGEEIKLPSSPNQKLLRNSTNSFESFKEISQQPIRQSPKLTMPADIKQILDRIEDDNTSMHQKKESLSQVPSPKLLNENHNQDLSLSETTSIQRVDQRKTSFLQQSRQYYNEVPKLRVSQTFISHPKSIIENQKQLNQQKEMETQLQKQITELKIYKENLSQELKQLEFKAMFGASNKKSSIRHSIYIWHLLLTSVICLIVGSMMRKIQQNF